jgi:integrase
VAALVMKAAMEIATITGMRQGDILKLKLSNIKPEGLPVQQNKTGKKQIFEITPALKKAIATSKSHPREAESIYIIANRRGNPYTSSGFKSSWQRLMNNAIKTGAIQKRFTFHDLRAKAGSDAEDNAKNYSDTKAQQQRNASTTENRQKLSR